jgi:hypothetical protein
MVAVSVTVDDIRRCFDAACACGPLTSILKVLHGLARSGSGELVCAFNTDALDDYLRERADEHLPIFAIPAAYGLFTRYLERPPASVEEEGALTLVLRIVATLDPSAPEYLNGFPDAQRQELAALAESDAISLRPEEWDDFIAAVHYRLISNPDIEGTVPHCAWVYPAWRAELLVSDLLHAAGRFGTVRPLLPGDPRTLPVLIEANRILGAPVGQAEQELRAALTSAKETHDLALIREVVQLTVAGKNRAEIVEELARREPGDRTAAELRIGQQIYRLTPEIRKRIPGFTWPEKRRPRGHPRT